MYTVLIVIHVIVSIFLIAVILLQAGRGGGLADSFGGSQMQNLFGTKSTTVLAKMTAGCAIMFIITCLSLAIISSHRSKSLIDKFAIPDVNVEQVTEKIEPVDIEEAKEVAPEEVTIDSEELDSVIPEDTDNVEKE